MERRLQDLHAKVRSVVRACPSIAQLLHDAFGKLDKRYAVHAVTTYTGRLYTYGRY